MDNELSGKECHDFIREVWEKYGELENPALTTSEIAQISDFLDDIERLVGR